MEEEDKREGRRERRARKKAEKSTERTPDVAGRQVYPQPGGQVPVARQVQPQRPPVQQQVPAATAAGPTPRAGPPGEPARVQPKAPPPAPGVEPSVPAPGVPQARPPAATPAVPGPMAPPSAGMPPAAVDERVPAGRPEERPEGQQPRQQPPPPQQPPPQYQPPPGYYWPPPPWYPPAFAPPGYGYGPGYPPGAEYTPGMPGMPGYPPPMPLEQTGQMPPVTLPAGAPPAPEWLPVPPPSSALPPPGEMTAEEAEFRGLTGEEMTHWRVDLKWIFGIIAVLLLFSTLTVAGFYRVSGPGCSREILEPLVDGATDVRGLVEDNYQELRGKARRSRTASFVIPDIGVQVTIKAQVINTLTAGDLADRVVSEVVKQIYSRGYRGNLPMPKALGVGEERAKAVAATLLSVLNSKTHSDLLWPLIVLAVLTVAVGVLSTAFCRGWGKALGAGIVIIAGTLPASLFIRVVNEFILGPNPGVFRGASHQALRAVGSDMLMFYDIALAAGALVLLGGVIGVVVLKKTRERVPPFGELKRPEQAVVGGPPV